MRNRASTLGHNLCCRLVAGLPRVAAQGKPVHFAQAKTGLIDINRAKAEELMKLEKLREARAAAIIKGRDYARKDEPVRKKMIPASVDNCIKDRIIARL